MNSSNKNRNRNGNNVGNIIIKKYITNNYLGSESKSVPHRRNLFCCKTAHNIPRYALVLINSRGRRVTKSVTGAEALNLLKVMRRDKEYSETIFRQKGEHKCRSI